MPGAFLSVDLSNHGNTSSTLPVPTGGKFEYQGRAGKCHRDVESSGIIHQN